MTICISVKVNECLVFAADSASSFDGNGSRDADGVPIQQVYRHGNKVFQLHHEKPIIAMTCGIGNFGRHTISTLAKQFRNQISDGGPSELGSSYTMNDVATMAHNFFLEQNLKSAIPDYEKQSAMLFELFIGGYSAGAELPELWKLRFAGGKIEAPVLLRDQNDISIDLGGAPDPVFRLVNGFGFRLEEILRSHEITPESHESLYQELAPRLYLPLINALMPIQDAIDLADFLADMTKKVFRFRAVPEYVSGDIDIAVVTRYEGFKWVRRKHYYPKPLNEGRNHDRSA